MKRRADTEPTGAGIRELKAHLSRYIGMVKEGRAVYVTERGKEVARLVPRPADPWAESLRELMRRGVVHWNGRRPRGPRRPVRLRGKGKLASEILMEMRRESLSRYERRRQDLSS